MGREGLIIFHFILFMLEQIEGISRAESVVSSIWPFFSSSNLLTSTYINRNSSLFEDTETAFLPCPSDPLQIPRLLVERVKSSQLCGQKQIGTFLA